MTNDRRSFLQKLLGLSASLPMLGFSWSNTSDTLEPQKDKLPLLLCSRGLSGGEKVLPPAWEKLEATNSILDAVELGANVMIGHDILFDIQNHQIGIVKSNCHKNE